MVRVKAMLKRMFPKKEVSSAFWSGTGGIINRTDGTKKYSELDKWLGDLYKSQHKESK